MRSGNGGRFQEASNKPLDQELDGNDNRTRWFPGGPPMPPWLWHVLVLGTVAGIAFRIIQALWLIDQGHFVKYSHYATQILGGTIPIERLPDLSAGYLWFVTGWFAIAGASHELLQSLQICLVGLSALLLARTAAYWGGAIAALATWCVLMLNRSLLVNAAEAEPETLLLLLHTATLWFVLRPSNRVQIGPRVSLTLAGLLIGLATVTRPTSIIVLPLWLLWLGFGRRHSERSMLDPVGTRVQRPLGGTLHLIGGFSLPVLTFVILNLSLTGSATLMNPGTVFYEGMNPRTTGLGGEAPSIVKQIEPSFAVPDGLHLAYRRIASLDRGGATSAETANRYWTEKAIRFAVANPGSATSLAFRKLSLSLSSYESYDLQTMFRRDADLRQTGFWIPFGLLLAAAAVGLVTSRWSLAIPLLAHGSVPFLVMTTFYVSSRQRNSAIPALAILCGLAVANLVSSWSKRRRVSAWIAVIGITAVTFGLGSPSGTSREDEHRWFASECAARAIQIARVSASQGDIENARRNIAAAATWQQDTPMQAAQQILRAHVVELLPKTEAPARRFDLALAAMYAEDWRLALRVLTELADAGYCPRRGAGTVSSIDYHKARCQLHIGHPEAAVDLLTTALDQVPGDPDVLELAAAVRGSGLDPVGRLDRLPAATEFNDSITVSFSRAKALADIGSSEDALRLLGTLETRIPELRGYVDSMRTAIERTAELASSESTNRVPTQVGDSAHRGVQ